MVTKLDMRHIVTPVLPNHKFTQDGYIMKMTIHVMLQKLLHQQLTLKQIYRLPGNLVALVQRQVSILNMVSR